MSTTDPKGNSMLDLSSIESDRDRETIARYADDIVSDATFARHAASARSIIGYQPPTGKTAYAKALAALAEGAALSDRQATLVRAIVSRLPLHGTGGDSVAAMYDAAGESLRRGYFDTIGNASPEPGRRSDHEHEYTLEDRVVLHHTLAKAASAYSPSAGIGWCLAAITKALHAHVVRP